VVRLHDGALAQMQINRAPQDVMQLAW